MNDDTITKKAASDADWTAFDALSVEVAHQAAVNDPDAQPLGELDMKRMKRTPQIRVIRRALNMSQEEFASRFHIPVGTLRDWEQGRCEPDQAARSYLTVIAREPELISKALAR